MNNKGMNTATSEMLIDMTVNPICFAPLSAAGKACSPCSMYRYTFSMTTIASSTTNPTEIVMAISERLSMLYPSRYMNPHVPASASGTVTLAMKVGQNRRRNRKITITTSAMLTAIENCTSFTDARIVVVRSLSTSSFTAGGIQRANCGNCSLMRLTVSITLAPACLKTINKTARRIGTVCVPAQPASSEFSTP